MIRISVVKLVNLLSLYVDECMTKYLGPYAFREKLPIRRHAVSSPAKVHDMKYCPSDISNSKLEIVLWAQFEKREFNTIG